jgi:hypothetical protein
VKVLLYEGGEALRFDEVESSRERVRAIGSELAQPMLDEDEII